MRLTMPAMHYPRKMGVRGQLRLKKLKVERDVDINATKRIFEMLAKGLEFANFRYQIIVLEHADGSIWGEIPNTVEVANWKAEGQGLIPASWKIAS
jgi:hypothetical protein